MNKTETVHMGNLLPLPGTSGWTPETATTKRRPNGKRVDRAARRQVRGAQRNADQDRNERGGERFRSRRQDPSADRRRSRSVLRRVFRFFRFFRRSFHRRSPFVALVVFANLAIFANFSFKRRLPQRKKQRRRPLLDAESDLSSSATRKRRRRRRADGDLTALTATALIVKIDRPTRFYRKRAKRQAALN